MSWTIDPAHSQITFSVRHMMISNARGRFENFSGVVDFNENEPAASTVSVKIDAASINTREPKRDGHLRSPDFFNADAFPYLTFNSNRVEKVNQNHGRIYGDLTIRDLTRPLYWMWSMPVSSGCGAARRPDSAPQTQSIEKNGG